MKVNEWIAEETPVKVKWGDTWKEGIVSGAAGRGRDKTIFVRFQGDRPGHSNAFPYYEVKHIDWSEGDPE